MARKRYIKPGFFKNEELASLPPLVRILFEGLWCYADREGRLEDRPLRLKSDIIPYDNLNVESALNKLQDKNFIIRYKFTDGKTENRFIQITNFKKHQDVHVNEQPSTIPPPVLHGASTVELPNENGGGTPLNLELNTLNLEPCIDVVDNAGVPEIEPPKEQPQAEKEKSSAKKENTLPTLDEAINQINTTAYWRISREHYKLSEDERGDFFKIFYEQNEDAYSSKLPDWMDIIKHFYNWIPIYQSKLKTEKTTSNGTAKIANASYSKSNKRDELLSLNQQAGELLATIASQ